MTKWIIAIGVLVIVGVGLWWSGVLSNLMPKAQPTANEQATTTPSTPTAQVNDLPTGASDTSDGAIVQDSAAVDTQLQALTSDQANVDSSANDKPVAQEF